jgi:hypothetical protein
VYSYAHQALVQLDTRMGCCAHCITPPQRLLAWELDEQFGNRYRDAELCIPTLPTILACTPSLGNMASVRVLLLLRADPLRVMRAVRFATRFNFAPDPAILAAASSDEVSPGFCWM